MLLAHGQEWLGGFYQTGDEEGTEGGAGKMVDSFETVSLTTVTGQDFTEESNAVD